MGLCSASRVLGTCAPHLKPDYGVPAVLLGHPTTQICHVDLSPPSLCSESFRKMFSCPSMLGKVCEAARSSKTWCDSKALYVKSVGLSAIRGTETGRLERLIGMR